MNNIKFFIISLVIALILSTPLLWIYDMLFPLAGFYGTFNNFYLGSLFGLTFSLPLSFGFFSAIQFSKKYWCIIEWTLAPLLIFDFLFWQIIFGWNYFFLYFLIGVILGIVGIALGSINLLFKKK